MDTNGLKNLLGIPKLNTYLIQADKMIKKQLLDEPSVLAGSATELLAAGGKRLRPLLVIVSAIVSGGKVDRKVLSAAAAVELVHSGSLVHDDIIDQSKFRRGEPSLYRKEGIEHAILVGDYLLTKGYGLALAAGRKAAIALAAATEDMCEGQSQELKYIANKAGHTYEEYFSAVEKKSAALISASCVMGALLSGASESFVQNLADFGFNFGVAFQLVDDLADGDVNPKFETKILADAPKFIVRAQSSFDNPAPNKLAKKLACLPALYLGPQLEKAKQKLS